MVALPRMLTRAIDVVREVVAYARGPGKSLQSTIAPNPWQDRQAQVLGPDLTPELLSGIILDRNLGYLQRWVDLADEAREKDPHLHSQLSIREESVVETEFVVHPGKGSNQQQAKRAAAVSTPPGAACGSSASPRSGPESVDRQLGKSRARSASAEAAY